MFKKLTSITMSICLFVVLCIGQPLLTASAETVNTVQPQTNINSTQSNVGTNLKYSNLLPSTQAMPVTSVANSGSTFTVFIYETIFAALVSIVIQTSLTAAWNCITSGSWGSTTAGKVLSTKTDYVKLDGFSFDGSLTANWCGTGYSNNQTIVMHLQAALYSAGFNPGARDGLWGANTIAALKGAQVKAKITADGIAGYATYTAIEQSN